MPLQPSFSPNALTQPATNRIIALLITLHSQQSIYFIISICGNNVTIPSMHIFRKKLQYAGNVALLVVEKNLIIGYLCLFLLQRTKFNVA